MNYYNRRKIKDNVTLLQFRFLHIKQLRPLDRKHNMFHRKKLRRVTVNKYRIQEDRIMRYFFDCCYQIDRVNVSISAL